MEEFEYDGNDILSIKMALENMLKSRRKYYIDNEKDLIDNNVINLNTSRDVVYYVSNMIDDYCWDWVWKKGDKND